MIAFITLLPEFLWFEKESGKHFSSLQFPYGRWWVLQDT